jgi:hypothetical protein
MNSDLPAGAKADMIEYDITARTEETTTNWREVPRIA